MSAPPLSRESLSNHEGGLWDYISPSRLNTWLACPLKFKFRYVEGERSPSSPALFLGKVVHAALEDFYRHRQLGIAIPPEAVISRAAECWNELAAEEDVQFINAFAEGSLKAQVAPLLRAYFTQLDKEEPPPAAVEVPALAPLVDPCTGEDLGIPLVGIIDLVLSDRSGPLVVDFKTTARCEEPLPVKNEIQLTGYAYLFRHGSGANEAGLEIRNLVKTKLPKVQCHRYPAREEKYFRRFFEVVRAYLDSLDSGKYLFRPGHSCTMCEFKSRCCHPS